MEEADNMAHSKRYLAVGSLFAVVLLVLFACGGGGGGAGGGGGLDGNLFGAVTDATQTAVVGATVTVYDNTGTGTVVATTTTDEAGRYAFNIATMDDYLVSAEMAPAFFPAGRTVTLVTGAKTVADINLASTRDRGSQLTRPPLGADEIDSTVESTVMSWTNLDPDMASITVPANSLVPAPTADTAIAYIAPVDTVDMDSGFADWQTAFVVAVGDPVLPNNVLKVYAATGLAIVDSGDESALTANSDMTLSMPIPSDPPNLRTDAPAVSTTLWKYEANTGRWLEAGTTGTADRVGDAFEAAITEGGLYAAGEVAAATPVIGILQYSDGPAAGGVTVIAKAVDSTYRSVTTTDDTGAFSVLVESGMQAEIEFISMGSGVQRTDSVSIDLGADPENIGTIVMADIDSAGTAVLSLADLSSTGFIPASGRIYVDPDSDLRTAEIADVVFVADTVGGNVLTLQSGKNGATLLNGLTDPVTIGGVGNVTINVQTIDGHSATLTVNATRNAGNNGWDMTLTSSFQL
jgi:hypothetical protein